MRMLATRMAPVLGELGVMSAILDGGELVSEVVCMGFWGLEREIWWCWVGCEVCLGKEGVEDFFLEGSWAE